MEANNTIYTATYSNVNVYEMEVDAVPVMRRQEDSYMNATQILKVAGIDKGKRTKILEREVHKGTHEKIQGGYGKYQGTWVPLERSKELAETYNVFDKLRPIIEFATTNGNSDDYDRLPTKEQAKVARKKIDTPQIAYKNSPSSSPHHTATASPSPHHSRPSSRLPPSVHTTPENHSRKKHKVDASPIDDASLEYHALLLASIQEADQPEVTLNILKSASAHNTNINQPIDDKGRTLLHLASALARVRTVSELITNGANIGQQDSAGETPLMHSVMKLDGFENKCFPRLLAILRDTLPIVDADGRTALHHTSLTAGKQHGMDAASYYMKHLLEAIGCNAELLNAKDLHGNTALTIAVRLDCNELATLLENAGASPDLENKIGLTAEDYRMAELKEEVDIIPEDNFAPSASQYSQSPHGPSQRGQEIVATVQKIVNALDEEYSEQLKAKDSELKQLQDDLKKVGQETVQVRVQLEERQAQSQRLAETKQKIRNLEAAIDSGWGELKTLWGGTEVMTKEAIDHIDENEDIDAQFSVPPTEGDAESQARILNARIAAYTQNNQSLSSQIQKLQDEVTEKELQCKRLIAACCNLPIDRIDDVVEPLTLAIESDPPDLDLSRVIGFMEKIKRQGTFGDSESMSTSDHNADSAD